MTATPAPAGARARLAGRFAALRHRNYRLYWSGQLVSLVGTWMQSVAQGWLMHRLTSSAFMLGLLTFTQFLPVLLFSLWAGVVADRMDKRRLLLITQTGLMLQSLTLAILVTSGMVQPWMILSLAFVFGSFNSFDMPTRQSFVVEMVGKDDLSNAIALNSTAFNTARIIGPAVAGILVATIGEAGCFWINAVTYLAVIGSLLAMDLPKRVAEAGGRTLSTLRDGIRYARDTRPIRNLLILLACSAGLGFQYNVLLPVYARDILHSGSEGYGLMVSAFGLGSLLSAIWMTRRHERWDLRRNLLTGLGVAAVGMAVFAWSKALPLSIAMGFVAGLGLILYVSSTNIMLQLTTEDRYRGRVMSLYTFMFIGSAPFGAIIAGAIAQRFGAPVATSLSATILFGGALWVAWRLRVLAAREAAQPAEPPVPPVAEKLG